MLRSEPEFDPSSKEINILERRDAIVAIIDIIAMITIVAVIARLLSIIK